MNVSVCEGNEISSMEVEQNSTEKQNEIIGSKLIRSETGTAVASTGLEMISPRRSRKVAGGSSEGIETGSSVEEQRKIYHYKQFDLVFDDGTEDGGGRIVFSDYQEKFLNSVDDYFLLMEDKCALSHNCEGRVKSVRSDMIDKVLPPPKIDPRKIADILARVGDGCIIATEWFMIDADKSVKKTFSL